MRTNIGTEVLITGLLLGMTACSGTVAPDAGPPVGDTGTTPTVDSGPAEPPPPLRESVDLLLVVDNSNSMTEEQASFGAELPELIRSLSLITDQLSVGIVTTDMGTGGFTVPTCARSDLGDDGVLRTTGQTAIAGCAATYPSFLEFDPAVGADAFAADLGCVAAAGTGGCGFEQQLDAMLKAISPAAPTDWTAPGYAPPTFFGGSAGHADGANAGLIEAGSVLAVVLLTDEEDCSASDPDLYNPSSATYGATDLNLRCFAHADAALHATSRYVDGLLQLRHRPERVVFVPIAGVPSDLTPLPGASIDWPRLIGPAGTRDPRMDERVDPANPSRLTPSCNTPRGLAFPPIRMLQVAQALEERGATVGIGSICAETGYAQPVYDAISRALCGPAGCTPSCAPSCADRACGDDGCGGSCGSCGAGDECVPAATSASCLNQYRGQIMGGRASASTSEGSCGVDFVARIADDGRVTFLDSAGGSLSNLPCGMSVGGRTLTLRLNDRSDYRVSPTGEITGTVTVRAEYVRGRTFEAGMDGMLTGDGTLFDGRMTGLPQTVDLTEIEVTVREVTFQAPWPR